MARFPIDRLRNIGIIAHIDAGKTTTTERFLFYAGETHKLGEVHDGEAVMDFRDDERERGITISSAATTLHWREHEITLIDTPGHVDFVAEVERSLRVLDGAVVIFDAAEGVEPQSESVWHQADRYAVPRLCFLNKMDKVGADFEAAQESMRLRLRARPLPLQLPVGAAEEFAGVIDLLERRLLRFDPGSRGARVETAPVPTALRDAVESARAALVEALADHSDEVAERFLAGEEVAAADLRPPLRAATLRGAVTPVLCGSALRNMGVQPLLDAVCAFLPSPADRPPAEGQEPGTGAPRRRYPRETDPFSAFLFKVTAQASADLHYARVYSGRAKTGDAVHNPRTGRKERLQRIFRMHAARGVVQDETAAGDIVAFTGLKSSATGDTLCAPGHAIEYAPIQFPGTVVSVAVEPRNADERDRLADVLARLEREDPTFHHAVDPETGQTILSGMGELHLEVLQQRMQREFRVQAAFGQPRVSYRETLLAPAHARGEFERSVPGQTLHGVVSLSLEPEPATRGVRVTHRLADAGLDESCIAGLLATVQGTAEGGGAYGFPMTALHADIVDAQVLAGNDASASLNSAATRALYAALRGAQVAVLEPIMDLEVRTPEDYLGIVLKHLHARRALISDTRIERAQAVVTGAAPLAEMFGFTTTLRSLTQGRASYSMQPRDYQPVPAGLATSFDRRTLD